MVSRDRSRPTREETRRRLFVAAGATFAEQGVAGASIDQITAAAGFSRGAFYSNFASKDELAMAMLEDHLERSQLRNRGLLARHPDPNTFVQALRDDVADEDDPLHQSPLLQIELMLYVARTPELRPALGEHLRVMRGLVGEIVTSILQHRGLEIDVEPDALGTILVAIEDGLRLQRIIDPGSTPPNAFYDALEQLQRMLIPDVGSDRK
jgi:AcrR family transcriptional regulator